MLQPERHHVIEPRMDADAVGNAVVYMDSLPLDANVQFMTVMARASACIRAHDFRDRRGEGNYVVPHFGFYVVNTLQIEVGPLANAFRGRFRDHARFRKCLGRCDFYRQPGPKTVFITPNAAHFRACITWNHESSSETV